MSLTLAVLQARMGSSRLPGKMLLHLAGRPLIDYALGRLNTALGPEGPLKKIILATSELPENDVLVAHVEQNWPGVEIVRGSESDVLSRFTQAIVLTGATRVVRATGDCPLLNIAGMVQMLEAQQKTGADIVNYIPGYEYIDKGMEVISAGALLSATKNFTLTPHDKEHVTSLLYRHPDSFNIHYIESEPFLRRGDIRLTIDTQEDLKFFKTISEDLKINLSTVSLIDIVTTLDNHPAYCTINQYSGRKSTRHDRFRLGFRCDGGFEKGLGHIVGCLRLAKMLSKELGVGAEFVLRNDQPSLDLIRREGFSFEILDEGISPEDDMEYLVKKNEDSDWSGIVINFCKDDLELYSPTFKTIKHHDIPLIFMDNPLPPSYLVGDLLINALPHPDYENYLPEQHPNCYDGLEYFIPQATATNGREIHQTVDRILITMGGSDPLNSTSKIIQALDSLKFQGFLDIVLGLACPHEQEVRLELEKSSVSGQININVSDLPDRMQKADLGVSALGLTTYEMAYYQLPVAIISGNPLNSTVASKYADYYGCAHYLGPGYKLTVAEIARGLVNFCLPFEIRKRMASKSRAIGSKNDKLISLIEKVVAKG